MSSKTDLRAYFKRRATGSDGPSAKKEKSQPRNNCLRNRTRYQSRN